MMSRELIGKRRCVAHLSTVAVRNLGAPTKCGTPGGIRPSYFSYFEGSEIHFRGESPMLMGQSAVAVTQWSELLELLELL